MIKVYFENNISAQLVAIFTSEQTYILCLPSLEKQAETQGCFITESIINEIELIDCANELINCGNSKEKSEGYGMLNVLNELTK